MKYIDEPGNVQEYTPALPDGAWTDDDTDIEWPTCSDAEHQDHLALVSANNQRVEEAHQPGHVVLAPENLKD